MFRLTNDAEELDLAEIAAPFTFRSRPHSIAPDLRPEWRIVLVVLLLRNCCRRRSSLARLHLLSWCCLSLENRSRLRSALREQLPPGSVLVRFEPFLVQAVSLAVAEGLLDRVSPIKVSLTAAGQALADRVMQAQVVMESEKQFMADIGTDVTEGFVNRVMGL